MVEIIPKQRQGYPLLTQILFFGSMALLLAAVGSFFLILQLQGRTEKGLGKVQQNLAQGKTQEEARLEKAIFQYRDKFNDFSTIARSRNDARPALEFLENYTHPKVVFTTLDLDPRIQTLKLVGSTLDFRTLQEQMAVFQNREELAGLNLSSIVLGEQGEVIFQLEMKFAQP